MQNHLKTARVLAKLLDSQFSVLGIKFGLDPILDLIPGLGDILGAILSFYLIWLAIQLKVPSQKITRMVINVLIDFLLGLFPIVGPIVDIFYKSNKMNFKILEQFSSKVVEGKIVE